MEEHFFVMEFLKKTPSFFKVFRVVHGRTFFSHVIYIHLLMFHTTSGFWILYAMNRYDCMDEIIVLNLRIFARNLKRTNMFRFMEIEDLEQELMYEVIRCLHNFDESRGNLEHFIRRILARHSANLLKSFLRKKRESHINFSEYTESKIGDSQKLLQ
jgi:hypothetical protein